MLISVFSFLFRGRQAGLCDVRKSLEIDPWRSFSCQPPFVSGLLQKGRAEVSIVSLKIRVFSVPEVFKEESTSKFIVLSTSVFSPWFSRTPSLSVRVGSRVVTSTVRFFMSLPVITTLVLKSWTLLSMMRVSFFPLT